MKIGYLKRSWLFGFIGLSAIFMLSACNGSDSTEVRLNSITGSGSTFIAPLMAEWASQYYQETGVQVNYQATGSGAGIRQIQEGIVDFAASDQPLPPEELNASRLIQFPIATGGIVPVVNIASLTSGDLVLDGETLAAIFSGQITSWDDPTIRALNPDLNLPGLAISVIHRSDGSGTTFNFTEYLAGVSPSFQTEVGVGGVVRWPTGVGAKGNAGVAALVQRVNGSIGYVEYAYTIANDLNWAAMINRDGYVIAPELESFQAASEFADWQNSQDYYLLITNQQGENVWPIAANTFILLSKDVQDHAKITSQIDFFNWAYQEEGNAIAYNLDYVPLPASVYQMISQLLQETFSIQRQG